MSEKNITSDYKKKKRLVEVTGGKCCICGYNKCLSALEFHHMDPTEKEFSISQNAHIAFEKALGEIQKCILVCSNCHREIHAGLIEDLPEPYIDTNLIEQFRTEIYNRKTKTHYYCIDCGKEVNSKRITRCLECANKAKQIVERPSREQLKQEIRTIPFLQLAKKYGVSDKTITKWCQNYNLPNRKKDINTYSDEEWEKI